MSRKNHTGAIPVAIADRPDIASVAELARNQLFRFPELFPVKCAKLLFQLHWQNPRNFRETEFVGQVEGATFEEVESRLRDMIGRRKDECPDGWVPMVCNQDAECFVRAVD